MGLEDSQVPCYFRDCTWDPKQSLLALTLITYNYITNVWWNNTFSCHDLGHHPTSQQPTCHFMHAWISQKIHEQLNIFLGDPTPKKWWKGMARNLDLSNHLPARAPTGPGVAPTNRNTPPAKVQVMPFFWLNLMIYVLVYWNISTFNHIQNQEGHVGPRGKKIIQTVPMDPVIFFTKTLMRWDWKRFYRIRSSPQNY